MRFDVIEFTLEVVEIQFNFLGKIKPFKIFSVCNFQNKLDRNKKTKTFVTKNIYVIYYLRFLLD